MPQLDIVAWGSQTFLFFIIFIISSLIYEDIFLIFLIIIRLRKDLKKKKIVSFELF